MHGIDPIRDGGVDLLHPLGEQVVVFAEDLALRLVALCLVALGQKGGEAFLFVGLDLRRVILGLLVLALLLLIPGGINGRGFCLLYTSDAADE